VSGKLTSDTITQKSQFLGQKRFGQPLASNLNFGGASGSNSMITSLQSALTQQKALQDPQEEIPFTAK